MTAYRILYDNQGGQLEVDPGSAGTTINFAEAPDFATLTAGQYIPIILDPGLGTFEIVHMTAYTQGNTSGTITRAAEDGTNWPAVAHPGPGYWVCAPTALDAQGPGIALTIYAPTSPDLIALTTSQMTKLDTTNLTFSFVAPLTGNVLIQVSAYWDAISPATAGDSTIVYTGLVIHGTTTQVGARMRALQTEASASATSNVGARVSHFYYVTSLTPGQTYQYDLCGWFANNSGTGSANLYCDDGTSGGTDELGGVFFMVDASL